MEKIEHGPAREPALPAVSLAAVAAAAMRPAILTAHSPGMSFQWRSLRIAGETGGALLAVTTVLPLPGKSRLRSPG